MIITDPKKLSMPQQVQKNKEDIEDIKKIIDGLDVEDNVVVVNDISQILTAEELEAIKQPVAFIVYNEHLYFKNKTTSTTAYFDVVFAISGSTVITFESSEIQVGLSNGALGIVNSTVSTYSKSEIDTKFATKTYVDTNFAALTGANFTGPITAPGITENMSGYSFTAPSVSGLVFSNLYANVIKNGNKITFVIAGNVKKTDGDIPGRSVFGRFTIPSSIGTQLYPSEIGGEEFLDARDISFFSTWANSVGGKGTITKNSNVLITFSIYHGSLVVDTTYYFRYESTFLLGDNLAE